MVKKKKIHAASRARMVKARPTARSAGSRPKAKTKRGKQRVTQTVPVVAAMPKIRMARKYRPVYGALVRLRERLARQINFLATDNLTRTQDDTEVDFRSKEQGTDNFDRDFALNRVSRDQDVIFEIDEALNRIQIGTYGKCENCGRSIERPRLSSLPYSRMCVACQSKTETGRQYRRTVEAEALYPSSDKAAAEAGPEDE